MAEKLHDEILKFYYDTLHLDFEAIEQAFLYFYGNKLSKDDYNIFIKKQSDFDEESKRLDEAYEIEYNKIIARLSIREGKKINRQRIYPWQIPKIHEKRDWIISDYLEIREKYDKHVEFSRRKTDYNTFKRSQYRKLINSFDSIIGVELAEECRISEACPMKALLPEYKVGFRGSKSRQKQSP